MSRLPAPVARRVGLLLPRLGTDSEGEALATVRALRRVLAAQGLDLHDLVAALSEGGGRAAPEASGPAPAELASWCLGSGLPWSERERAFLWAMARHRRAWDRLTPRQQGWLRDLGRLSAAAWAA